MKEIKKKERMMEENKNMSEELEQEVKDTEAEPTENTEEIAESEDTVTADTSAEDTEDGEKLSRADKKRLKKAETRAGELEAELAKATASLAEALADTVASGIGVLNRKAFDLFRMKPCSPGISGGMSLLGTASSLLAATLMGGLAVLFDLVSGWEALIIVIAAFLGGVFDSFLGSVVQVKFKCTVCGEIVEREEHCGHPTEKHSGLAFVTNDLVNLLGTAFAAIIASLIFII